MSTLPRLCHVCSKKPSKKKWRPFCSQSCAAAYGTMDAEDLVWCDKCGGWLEHTTEECDGVGT